MATKATAFASSDALRRHMQRLLHVDSSRPVSANTGHSPTGSAKGQVDPKATFKFDAMNGWKARESGLRLKAQAAPEAAVPSSWGDRVNTTLPDGTPREGWRGLPIRNAIQRACILRGRAAKRDNKLSHSKSLPPWSIRFRACAPKSSNRVPEAATKSFTVREISTSSARVSETSGRLRSSTNGRLRRCARIGLIATETRRKTTIIRNSRADLKAPVTTTGDLSARNRGHTRKRGGGCAHGTH